MSVKTTIFLDAVPLTAFTCTLSAVGSSGGLAAREYVLGIFYSENVCELMQEVRRYQAELVDTEWWGSRTTLLPPRSAAEAQTFRALVNLWNALERAEVLSDENLFVLPPHRDRI